MSEHPMKSVVDSLLSGIKSVADVDTVIGKPIETPDGTVIIPVSKVSLGFGMGGSDLNCVSSTPDGNNLFGGGTGGGLKLEPVAFLVVSNGDVRLLSISESSDLTELVNFASDLVHKFIKKKNKDID
ncbi:MAG: spore germination protein GerW family protein [Eubacteriales bacterium]|nr:spore germination protein GerW family protein [Eubacteriales bacterium]